jgi:hypothetical protein
MVTREEIDAKKSKNGGWTKETLASWGVPWPPPKGWRKALIAGEPVTASKASSGKWTEEEMKTADLVHGPDSTHSDTYRLHVPGTDDRTGKYLDVPGWMVGDQEGAELRMKAAEIIRQRLLRP